MTRRTTGTVRDAMLGQLVREGYLRATPPGYVGGFTREFWGVFAEVQAPILAAARNDLPDDDLQWLALMAAIVAHHQKQTGMPMHEDDLCERFRVLRGIMELHVEAEMAVRRLGGRPLRRGAV